MEGEGVEGDCAANCAGRLSRYRVQPNTTRQLKGVRRHTMSSALKQSSIKAKACRAAGLTSAFAALGMGLAFTPLASVVPAYAAYLLLRRAKKHTVVDGDTVLREDTRPPVLFLRSFAD